MRISARQAAKRFVETNFPACEVAYLAGSVVRGEETESSDLDIIIIDSSVGESYRQSLMEFDWPIEVFVHNLFTYKNFFKENVDRARPSLPQMCAEGIILRDNGHASRIKNEALQLLKAGPTPWKTVEIENARYHLTDLLNDLEGSTNSIEDLFIVSKLADLTHEFVLRVNGHWIGEGKWIIRALKEYDEFFAERFAEVFDTYYSTRKKVSVIQFVDEIISPFGGRLFEGYSSPSHKSAVE
ncbi:nucleotidyltransferase domain-containing protein [Fictibacillus nanhaiensis]|uniref:nucleotidyltransferase domain-containing protein n=1 Tax=Fictibacillus nanhaiensis TaxID=742169 RepID=UPI001C98B812|nr:nucleotidyltransferase domain-containing protein [Fictibacillus nanhaiensis]MBY6036225.1 nucleotidyltransferase domain-containing protein [Fictibacillus nanhaiensis]